ncbi:stress response protein NST1 [Striga asiatica]|uniref:Stress response protein NST1 n=1 Tax=Striga asiatica TaxID=4170 RepID=A0A5A7R3T7_STRAF|nr:stress response protein NST1 [Striga asiatica]
MPGIAQRVMNDTGVDEDDGDVSCHNPLVRNGKLPFHSFHGSSVSSNGFWSQHRDDMSYNQLQKFWSELTPQARQDLLRIDKQTLFEHARKNMYCSRCNGLLLEGFLQIVMYGKSLQQDANGSPYSVNATDYDNDADLCMANGCKDDIQDPSVHQWGGLTTTRDGTLTLLDCYLYSKSLMGLQNVFDSARARERERELLYPDACGGGGRGWIRQGVAGYGRSHGTRDSCALHTARLSVETLVDFWSALGEETRHSLLRMKEEDFVERLMFRFDSKRFCRDCRRNVIREFKELKELKRMRKETRCTSWFCVADTAFQYEVSRDTVQADWQQTFSDAFGTYRHFEWAIGSEEGKYDILEFENVGLSGRVQVNGLDLSGLNACYITVRACKMDGRINELRVKAHALRGQQCVHCRLVVGDGLVMITRGESIIRFFEHAEEAEEEEDDDSMDKDGNELDGECSRPQKHAKSPELAREFLLDAATVIFKEQVEKAFREGTARQNAHSIFVCLALKLLEERVHVACKEIITLEKQMKLLEEEEMEKREEEERKERKRAKEREKKLRRKERLREKESREKKSADSNLDAVVTDVSNEDLAPCIDEKVNDNVCSRDSSSERAEPAPSVMLSPDDQNHQLSTGYAHSNMDSPSEDNVDGEYGNTGDWNTSFPYDHLKYSRRKLKFRKDSPRDLNLRWPDRRRGPALSGNGVTAGKYESRSHADGLNGFNKQLRTNAAKSNLRYGNKSSEKFQCTNSRIVDSYDSHSCSCNYHLDYRSRSEPHIARAGRGDPKCASKLESPPEISKTFNRGKRYTQVEPARDNSGRLKNKIIAGTTPNIKKVWEPLDSQKKCTRSNSDSDVTLRSTAKVEASESDQIPECCSTSSDEVTDISVQTNHEDHHARDLSRSKCRDTDSRMEKPQDSSMSNSSNSDNGSSCLSEGDSNMYSNPQNLESTSPSDGKEISNCFESSSSYRVSAEDESASRGQDGKIQEPASATTNLLDNVPKEPTKFGENGRASIRIGAQPQSVVPQLQNRNVNYPIYQAPTMSYYHQNPVSWPSNGLMSFPHSNHYLFTNGYGYGLNGNAPFMQYGALQPLAPPLLNHSHVPVFQPVSQVSTNEPTHLPSATDLPEMPKAVDDGWSAKADKTDMCGNGFSLFHFGGPVALSTGFKADPTSLNEGIIGDKDKSSATGPDNDSSCSEKDPVEEYNLFAATNGIKFSIF